MSSDWWADSLGLVKTKLQTQQGQLVILLFEPMTQKKSIIQQHKKAEKGYNKSRYLALLLEFAFLWISYC